MAEANLFVPLWQDSGISNEIYHGSLALRRLIGEEVKFHTVSVPEHGLLMTERGVYGYATVLNQLLLVQKALAEGRPATVFTVGGGCGVEVPILAYLAKIYPELAIFWFDAHGDINSPESSPSKYFHGMPLRFLLEHIEDNAISEIVSGEISPANVLLLGTRDLDAPEMDYLRTRKVHLLKPLECDLRHLEYEPIFSTAEKRRAYIHIDLDCIDPKEYKNVKCPAKDGLSIRRICKLIGVISKRMNVVGFSVLENVETDQTELKKLSPIMDWALKI